MIILNLLAPDKIRLGSIELIDFASFSEMFIRFSLNLIVIFVLIRCLYYSTTRRKDYLFTFILISCVIFLLCYLLANVKLQLGFALGLFAIFGIIRYRTNAMPIREMTYLFLVIGISIINALADTKTSVAEVLFTNIIILLLTYGFEKIWLLRHEGSRIINYEKIDLIKPARHKELMADLQERTGINKIDRIEIGKMDFLKDTCLITIFYEEKKYTGIEGEAENEKDDDDDDD